MLNRLKIIKYPTYVYTLGIWFKEASMETLFLVAHVYPCGP